MSRIFLSHSSKNNREATALKLWLESQGWKDEVFLDLDPVSGIKSGTRWKKALSRANAACEAIICLTSPEWVDSAECVAEFRTAENNGKQVFVAQISELGTADNTREWQGIRLFGDGPKTMIHVGESREPVQFMVEGLARLKYGLLDAGVSGLLPRHFPWPPSEEPERAPYRGLEPLDVIDAGIFFGRDAEILRGLAEIERMRLAADLPLFVILGASGAGKSSFLRAGLLPRLRNEDRRFFSLGIVRPDSHPIYGDRGLAHAIASAVTEQLKPRALNPGNVKDMLRKGSQSFVALLKDIQAEARSRVIGLPETAPAPTLVLAIDQAEELFSQDATAESRTFLELIGAVLRRDLRGVSNPVSIIIALTIRSDRYEPLQTCRQLSGIKSVLFDDLRPMPATQYKEIIVNPASRAQVNGQPLNVEPTLVQELLSESAKGADTLPLLSLTLARLYRDYSSDGDLLLKEYQAMGGMKYIIATEAESVLSSEEETREGELQQLHAAFIPWLADINQDNDSPMRRVAAFSKLPPESHPLVQALIEKRLLLSDLRDGEQVVEVAHESLFRQWKVLADWLDAHREDLKETNRLEQDARAWRENGKKDEWLRVGERLTIGERLAKEKIFAKKLEGVTEFLQVSRQREETRKQAEEDNRQAEINAALDRQAAAEIFAEEQRVAAARAEKDSTRLRRGRFWLGVVLAGALIAAAVAIGLAMKSREQFEQATAVRLVTEAQAILADTVEGRATIGLLKLLAAGQIFPNDKVEDAMQSQVIALQGQKKIIEAGSKISSVAFSPDGTQLLSGGADGAVRRWDAQTGRQIGEAILRHQPDEQFGGVTSVAFEEKGTQIVSGGGDGTIRLWGVQGKATNHQWNSFPVTSVAISDGGNWVVSGGWDGMVRVWSAKTFGDDYEFPDRTRGGVSSVAFNREGTQVVSGNWDGTVRLWGVQTRHVIGAPFRADGQGVSSVAFNREGSQIVSGGWDGTVRLWDVQRGQAIGAPFRGHQASERFGGVNSVAFNREGTQVVSGGWDGTIRLWDVQRGEAIGAPFRGHLVSERARGVSSVAFNREGTQVVSGGWDGTIRLWDVQTGSPFGGIHKSIGMAFTNNGLGVLFGAEGGIVQLWNARTGQRIGAPLKDPKQEITCIAINEDLTRAASGGKDGMVRLWDVQSGATIGEPRASGVGTVDSVAFNAQGTQVVSGGSDGTVQRWDAGTGAPLGEPLKGHKAGSSFSGGSTKLNAGVNSVTYDPQGTKILSGGGDGMARLWNAKTGAPIGKPFTGHKPDTGNGVTSVAFNHEGTLVVTGGGDGTIQLWDATTGEPFRTPLMGHQTLSYGNVAVVFSPDGRRLLSGGSDGMLRLWDVQRGAPIGKPFLGDERGVKSVAFSPDGTLLVSVGVSGTVRFWPAPKTWPDVLCAKLAHNLSHKEWREHVSSTIDYIPQCKALPIPPDEPSELKTHTAGSEVR